MARTQLLTEEQKTEVRRLYASGRYPQHKLADLFDVSQPTISRIVVGVTRAQFPLRRRRF